MERVVRILVTIPDEAVQELQESNLTEADILAEATRELLERNPYNQFPLGAYEFIEYEEGESNG